MPMINFTNPITLLIAVILFVLVLWLGKETKKSFIPGLFLAVFLGLSVIHLIQFSNINITNNEAYVAITRTMGFDLIFVFLGFISYLWIDDIEAKENKKKSIDNSLEWFWGKV